MENQTLVEAIVAALQGRLIPPKTEWTVHLDEFDTTVTVRRFIHEASRQDRLTIDVLCPCDRPEVKDIVVTFRRREKHDLEDENRLGKRIGNAQFRDSDNTPFAYFAVGFRMPHGECVQLDLRVRKDRSN